MDGQDGRTDAKAGTCDICETPIRPDEGPAGNGDCYSASGYETVCDSCMTDLTEPERDYIQGAGPKAGRWSA